MDLLDLAAELDLAELHGAAELALVVVLGFVVVLGLIVVLLGLGAELHRAELGFGSSTATWPAASASCR